MDSRNLEIQPEAIMAVVHRFTGTDTSFEWDGVLSKKYEGTSAKGTTGKVMIGNNEGAPYFIFRYFRIEPGGHSTLNDHHSHDHGVLILHGKALVTIEDQVYELNPRDIIYIKGLEHHSLAAHGDEPLGFLCVIANKEILTQLGVNPV
jgi:quercetin dioxygenase-like cupin family protein